MSLSLLFKPKSWMGMSLRQWLFVSCAFSLLLVCARVVATGTLTYAFLVWNLFLGYIPYTLSEWLHENFKVVKRWKKIGGLLLWLLFVPNAFYIVTDIFHLDQFDNAPKWFDLLILFSFAWNGLLLGVLSVRRIEHLLERSVGGKFTLLFILAVMWLNAFGIYIGRYLRYNSWDIITQPFSLFGEMLQVLIHPLRKKMEWGMIGAWSVFMSLLYINLKKMSEFTSDHATKK